MAWFLFIVTSEKHECTASADPGTIRNEVTMYNIISGANKTQTYQRKIKKVNTIRYIRHILSGTESY